MATGFRAFTEDGVEPLPTMPLTKQQIRIEWAKLAYEMVNLMAEDAHPYPAGVRRRIDGLHQALAQLVAALGGSKREA
jgi:hypothetical protein